ncbi:MAG: PBP1A family penicillin-binding protein, partial [Eggerthellaceae bacterium]
YQHGGVDLWGIARAVWVNVTHTGHEGASTITQQFVRNTILADEAQESTLKRKVREAWIAIQLEGMYSKDEILQMYLNTINYGQGAYGIQAASELYFSKRAKDLSVAEAATLIGIPQAPTYNNPIDNPDNCIKRRNLVLDRMLTNGVITQQQHDEAQAEPITLNITKSDKGDGMYQYKYFTSYVRETLLNQYSSDEVFKGGMQVITTLDIPTQQAAEEASDRKLATLSDNLELAMVSVDPNTGFIKALVGGRDYDQDEFNLATQAKRQPGSSFKTFTLLAALNDGVSPDTNLNCTSHVDLDGWEVENYGGANYGVRSIASAFAVSSNTGFAQLCTEIGPDKVADMAKTCGIESQLDAYPSITLGSEEVTVREMAQAYATIANGGTKHEATCIQSIKDGKGNTIYEADTTGEKVLDTALTQAATQVMEGVVTNGTGRGAAMSNGQPVAGKTGTSENWRDKWFCGITPQLSTAVWIGGREETRMPSSVAADGVFGDFMNSVLGDQPIEQFPTSPDQLEYTIHDFGQGSGSVGNAPEHEGEAAEAPSGNGRSDGSRSSGSDSNQDNGSSAGSGAG